jgi:hypothetical protein
MRPLGRSGGLHCQSGASPSDRWQQRAAKGGGGARCDTREERQSCSSSGGAHNHTGAHNNATAFSTATSQHLRFDVLAALLWLQKNSSSGMLQSTKQPPVSACASLKPQLSLLLDHQTM